MANNKNTTNIESTLLNNKIVELSTKLNTINQSGVGITQEELIDEAVSFLSTYFRELSKPIFSPTDVSVDQKPNVDIYNENFSNILSDLKIIFSEFENIESVILSHFNFMVSDTNQILTGLKQVYSKLGDYILFTKDATRDSFYFSDSFNNQSRVDFNSSLLNSTQCDVDQTQGIVTLPLSNKTIISVTEQPVINSNSNGTPGNAIEDPTGLSADINRINDSNPDTWFEYERLITVDDGIPLTLDITINLSDPKIINYIRINPNNFGTKNQVVIDTIETSADGKSYLSIKDDVPLNGFITQDEDNVFILAPSSSKFAGQGIYTFNPRKIKYVHLIFKQFTPYAINDTQLRYAIGIRDIEISTVSYGNAGEIISANYSADAVFKKIALITNQNPVIESDLASIDHFISPDNGSTWNQIQAQDFISTSSIPKLLNFNTLDINSINTQNPIKSLRYKAVLKRNSQAFSAGTVQNKDATETVMELHRIPTQTPFNITLNANPISDSILVLDPAFGSRGIDNKKYTIGIGTGNKIEFNLPFTNIQNDFNKIFTTEYNLTETNPEEVRINGELWTRSYLNGAGSTDKLYELDNISGKIKFGDGINGKAVPSNGVVDIKFTPERLFISSQQLHNSSLSFITSRDRKSVTVKRYLASTTFSEVLKKNSRINKLTHPHITNILNFSDKTTFINQKVFIDGFSELISTGDWSLDTSNGIVYSKTNTSSVDDSSIIYQYNPELILNDTDWSFSSDGEIIINSDSFASISISNESIPASKRYFNLGNLSILKGTVSFNDTVIFKKEVPFIDGRIELSNNIKTSENMVASSPVDNIISFNMRMPIVNDISYDVVFSNKTIFATRVTTLADVNSTGKYYVDLANRIVYLFSVISISSPGGVSYYYQNQAKKIEGLYSINYKTGEVFTAVSTNNGTTVQYQYTNFLVSYPIARKILSDNFSFDARIVTISEREILTRTDLNATAGSTQSNFYQISFDIFIDNETDIQDLEPFFTPVLKDYAIKIIPEGALLF